MKYLILALCLSTLVSIHKPPPKELTEREIWEIRGKWRVQLERFRQMELQEYENFEITVMDSETYQWQEALKLK